MAREKHVSAVNQFIISHLVLSSTWNCPFKAHIINNVVTFHAVIDNEDEYLRISDGTRKQIVRLYREFEVFPDNTPRRIKMKSQRKQELIKYIVDRYNDVLVTKGFPRLFRRDIA